MVINPKKTKVISFNKTRKWNFPLEVHFSDNKTLECVSQTKLVGVIVSDDLKWAKNTQYICDKVMTKIWVLRRMKKIGLEVEHIFDTYIKEIRSVLELAVPVWHGGLTRKLSGDIERIQKVAFKVILGDDYHDYNVACTLLETETLEMRRVKLCLKFARKDIKKETTLFNVIPNPGRTRDKNRLVHECNTKRFQNSSLPYLSILLNQQK